MMEGYFVRTLGMHRVYNSAFMNMLKREENEKYRQTIKNVLDFDPEILKRFVNFMNNPDEETAVAQFGDDDKYFGVCTLMCTMPGLPMFGHGQVEGFHEKYGMEYRRAQWDEQPNERLVARHEREIFPLLDEALSLQRRREFALYDFVAGGRRRRRGRVRVLERRGRRARARPLQQQVQDSARPHLRSDPDAARGRQRDGADVAEALGISRLTGRLDDLPRCLEAARIPAPDARDRRRLLLGARRVQVPRAPRFRGVHATAELPYGELAAELAGRGCPRSSRRSSSSGFARCTSRCGRRSARAPRVLAPAGTRRSARRRRKCSSARGAGAHVADGLAYMRGGPKAKADSAIIEPALVALRHRFTSILNRAHARLQRSQGDST